MITASTYLAFALESCINTVGFISRFRTMLRFISIDFRFQKTLRH
jgi:hypothetical protein